MANFITLNCPSCGGKLSVSPGTISLTCQHCGNEHMVKQDAGGALQLESFARCPVCGRNDRCEKVSAVIASQSHEISGIEKKTETIVNPQGQRVEVVRDVPFTRQQISTLGARLAPPGAPQISTELPPSPGSGSWILSGVLTAGLGACLGLGGLLYLVGGAAEAVSQTGSATSEEILVTLLAGCGGSAAGLVVIAAAVGIFIMGRRNVARRKEEHAARIRDIFSERRQVQEAWDAAMERWRSLYYCARDDVIFLPGEGSSAPVGELYKYLQRRSVGK
jgi:hypothetical protein